MFDYNYKKMESLPIFYDKTYHTNEKESLFNIKKYLDENKDENVYIYQIVVSPLSDSLFNLKEEKKLQFFEKNERILISKLDEDIFENRIWFFRNQEKKYTKEYLNKIEEFKQKQYSLSESEEKTLDFFRMKWLEDHNIKDKDKIEKLTKIRKEIDWGRKFEFKDKEGEIIRFDYRNSLTTFFTVWNYKKGYKILWIWWGGSSWSRETFSKGVEQMYLLLTDEKMKDRFRGTDVLLYDNSNHLRHIRSYRDYMLINCDVGSNYPDMPVEIKEKIRSYFPSVENICYSYSNLNFPVSMIREFEGLLKNYKNKGEINKDEFVEKEFKRLIKYYEQGNSLYLKKEIPVYNSPIKINPPEWVKEWLLYIEQYTENGFDWKSELIFYFWTLKNSTGDDWDDYPAIHNSGIPYQDCITKVIRVKNHHSAFFKFDHNMDEYCFYDIKQYKKVIWSFVKEDGEINFKFWDEFNKVFKYISEYDYDLSVI